MECSGKDGRHYEDGGNVSPGRCVERGRQCPTGSPELKCFAPDLITIACMHVSEISSAVLHHQMRCAAQRLLSLQVVTVMSVQLQALLICESHAAPQLTRRQPSSFQVSHDARPTNALLQTATVLHLRPTEQGQIAD